MSYITPQGAFVETARDPNEKISDHWKALVLRMRVRKFGRGPAAYHAFMDFVRETLGREIEVDDLTRGQASTLYYATKALPDPGQGVMRFE